MQYLSLSEQLTRISQCLLGIEGVEFNSNLESGLGFQTIVNLFPGTTGSQHIITLHFSEYLGKSQPAKDSVAQLIADSTEKKFRFNSLFKGIWKKKQAQYSLDT